MIFLINIACTYSYQAWKESTTCDIEGLKCLSNITASLSALKTDDENLHDEEEGDLIEGADCNCPVDCEETVYYQVS